MSLPKVSILIPLYNHAQYISKLLNSILEDEYENKEIIIINDGSTDNSDEIVNKWMKVNTRIEINYKYRENKGLKKTLNELILLSTGKYIINIASDDYLINNTILNRVKILEKNPEKLMLVADAIVVDNKNELIYSSANFEFHKGKKENYYTDVDIKNEILYNWAIVGPVYMVNKNIYNVIGFYDPDIYLEDWDYAVRCVAKNLILFYDEKVAAYRLHENNTIKNKNAAIIFSESCIKTIEKHSFKFKLWDRIKLWNKSRRLKRKINKIKK